MCMPDIDPPAMPASNVPSMGAAGGLAIGAARNADPVNPLGRLKLRTDKKAAPAEAANPLALPVDGTPAPRSETFQYTPNPDLRIPIEGL